MRGYCCDGLPTYTGALDFDSVVYRAINTHALVAAEAPTLTVTLGTPLGSASVGDDAPSYFCYFCYY